VLVIYILRLRGIVSGLNYRSLPTSLKGQSFVEYFFLYFSVTVWCGYVITQLSRMISCDFFFVTVLFQLVHVPKQ